MNSSKKEDNTSGKSVINILLDLDGTCDNIDSDLARIFILKLDKVRRYFNAELTLISISTHYSDPSRIKMILDLLTSNINDKIDIGPNFYYGGIYDYKLNSIRPKEKEFNTDKIQTFKDYYLNKPIYNTKFIAIFDDMIFSDSYMDFKDDYPILICRPSQIIVNQIDNNLMSYSTSTKGFYGVVEGLDQYMDTIKNIKLEEILKIQKEAEYHISQHEIVDKIMNKDYEFIEKNFQNIKFNTSDYFNMIYLLINIVSNKNLNENDIYHLNNILELIINNNKLEKEEQETIKRLTKIINNN
ncbi:MAG: hypothetical protein IKO49_04790 [Bacilli bacterium]|nr:hypothetical protein [Bacilli bacterium]